MNFESLHRKGKIVTWSLGALFTIAFTATIYSWLNDPITINFLDLSFLNLPIKFGFRIDALSTLIFSMVSLLGIVISFYSVTHLKGDYNSSYFFKWLLGTIVSVSLMVISSNLIQFFLMWLTTSWGLHQLLIYYRNRPQALNAARKKFLISRLGDLALLIGIILSYQVFGSFEFQEIFNQINSSFRNDNQIQLTLIAFFFVLGAMTKSAQMPFHFWLPETMETPSPVSALMHAGIINAGGFLLIRLNPLIQSGIEAQIFLTLVGASTAVFGSLVMITQNHIKKKLAYSTISQMGMMMFACGIGAYPIALFHIISHSFYKAYAFLTTGTQIEESKKLHLKFKPLKTSQLFFIGSIGSLIVFLGLLLYQGRYSTYFLYLGILFLGIFQNGRLISPDLDSNPFYFGRIFKLISAIVSVFAIEMTLSHKLSPLISNYLASTLALSSKFLLVFTSFLIFLSGFYLTAKIVLPKSEFSKKVYFYLWNGGYFSLRSDAFIHSLYRGLSKQLNSTDIDLSKEPIHAET